MVQAIATSTIVAQAFRHMELSPAWSLDETSEEAVAAKAAYPDALQMMLELADWSFAMRFVALPEIAELPEGNLAPDETLPYLYKLPDDCLVVRQVGYPDCLGLHWRIELDLMRANQSGPLPLRYTAKIQNETQLPALFREAVALQLAVLLMRQWVPQHTKHRDLRLALQEQVMQALHADARSASAERYDPIGNSADWVADATR